MAFFILFLSSALRGQNDLIEYEKIDITDGLVQNTVECVYQDKLGFLWIGTRFGLSRFDGVHFTNYLCDPKDKATLSDKAVNDICEDENKNLYLATDNGLSIYLRLEQKFQRIYRDTSLATTLPSNTIYALNIDKSNRLWIGTRDGLILLDLNTQKFILPHEVFKNIETAEKEFIMTIKEDKYNIYLGTAYSGVYILNKKSGKVVSYLINKKNQFSYLNNTIYSIITNQQGKIWLATGDGIAGLNPETGEIKRYLVSKNLNKIENYILFNQLLITKNGRMLCGSSDFGMYEYDRQNDVFTPFNIRENESGKLSGKSYSAIFEDRTGVLWLGTRNEGLLKVNLHKKPFGWIGHTPNQSNSIVDNNIFSLLEDSEKQIWIGTLQGISIIDENNRLIRNLQPGNSNQNTIISNRVWALFEDSKKNIWIGTSDGLNIYRPQTKRFEYIRTDYHSPNQLPENEVFAVNEDYLGNIWIGTANGLSYYNIEKGKFSNYFYSEKDEHSVTSNTIWGVFIDSKKRTWIGTKKGLVRFIPETEQFQRIKLTNRLGTEWTGINSIAEDTKGILWLGTDNGLVRLNPDNLETKNYSIFEKTGNHVVFSVKIVNNYVWFSTINGLARLNIITDELSLFTDKDGIKSNEFNFPSIKTSKNKLYFGGTDGITYFNPNEIKTDTFSPPIVFTGLKINFSEIRPGETYRNSIPLEMNVNFVDNIKLAYDDNIFSISFASLDFKNKEKIEYAYFLEGINQHWVNLGSDNSVNFTGLKPGKYTLKVKATNSDGVWNSKIKSLSIVISPPWWQTGSFLLSIAVIAILLIVFIVKRREHRLKKAKDILEVKVQERTNEISMQKEEIKSQNELIEKQYNELVEKSEVIEKQNQKLRNRALHLEEEIEKRHADLILAKDRAEESDRLKSAFISNISHEIRTPLNAVIGFSELLSYEEIVDEDRIKFLDVIKKSSNDLLLLLNKLIDISVIESKRITLSNAFFRLNVFLEELKEFSKKNSMLKSKELILNTQTDINDDKFLIYSDRARLEQILNSLINNAIKYTESGSITFGYKKRDKQLEFFVSDTGIGIPQDKIKQLFSRFNKFEQSKDKLYRGAGLSLSISKDLIELMGGKIWAKSEVDVGTTFYFSLPINEAKK